ncbi:MAG: hypothetical protein ACO1Q7_05470 [Gemmatimonas sp.]
MTSLKLIAAGVLMALSATSIARAQDASTADAGTCWRGKKLPQCKTVLLTEYSYYQAATQPSRTVRVQSLEGDFRYSSRIREKAWNLGWEVGALRKVSPKGAMGATFLVGVAGSDLTYGGKLRYRRWLSGDGLALDVGVGARTADEYRAVVLEPSPAWYSGPSTRMHAAFTGDVAVTVYGNLGVVGRIDMTRFDGRYRPNYAIGFRGGSLVGVVASAATGITALAVLGVNSLMWQD